MKPFLIALVGPTCAGKTALSLQLAEKLNGEIVACDSRTIYKYMDIGTAKPTKEEQAKAPHHLIDVLEPDRFFTVAEYRTLANQAIEDILRRGKTPIVCGGTGFYARALLEGIDMPAVPPNPELREKLNQAADEKGNEHLHEQLKELDPTTAKRLNINDRFRIIRALEVSLIAGKPFSSLAKKGDSPYNTCWAGLYFNERNLHKEIISKRLEEQISLGLVDEVYNLWTKPTYRTILSNAINYKEFFPYLEKKDNLENAKAQCVLHNFQLARKQMIWFKTNPKIQWFAADEMKLEEMTNSVIELFS